MSFSRTLLAGILLSLGGYANLVVSNKILGAILFTFGLASIVQTKSTLLTGEMSQNRKPALLTLILLGNLLGSWIVAFLTFEADMISFESIQNFINFRETLGPVEVLVRAIGCGIIVTSSIRSAKEDNWIVLLIGIPLFILSGMLHCVADMFTYSLATFFGLFTIKLFIYWILTVLGNWIGCNIPVWLSKD